MSFFLLLFNYLIAEEIKIKADIVRINTKRKISTFHGNVLMNIRDGVIKSDTAEYSEQEKRVIFSGKVSVEHRSEEKLRISSGKAVYLIDEELLNLTCGPSISYLLEATTRTIYLTSEEMKFDLKNNIFHFCDNVNVISEDVNMFADEGICYLDKDLIELNRRSSQIKIIYKDKGIVLADNVVFDIVSRFFLFKGNVNLSYGL